MALDIVYWPDPVLTRPASPVGSVDEELRSVVAAMRRVMFRLKGVGLAAPQVGVGRRVMLVCPSGAPGDEEVVRDIVASTGMFHPPEVDIAVDPLEGTNLCASGGPGAMAVLAVAKKGDLLNAPDTYMYKLATGPEGKGVVHLEMSPTENLRALAAAKRRRPDEMTVVVLDRPRHSTIIQELRDAGARIVLIQDGDVAPAVATCIPKRGVDMVIGIGGAPEGVLAASALHAMEGEFFGQLRFRSEEERQRAIDMGFLKDPDKIMEMSDLVRGDVIFVATGVTTGHLLKGVRRIGDHLHLQTMALRSQTGTIRMVETQVDARRFPYHYLGRL